MQHSTNIALKKIKKNTNRKDQDDAAVSTPSDKKVPCSILSLGKFPASFV
jgi:hypothetical protein